MFSMPPDVPSHLGIDVCDLLYRATLPRAAMARCDDAAIRALTEVFDVFILAVDDELLPDGGE